MTLEKTLGCKICSKKFVDPTVVEPCGHVFCYECIMRLTTKKKQACPICSTKIKSLLEMRELSQLVNGVKEMLAVFIPAIKKFKDDGILSLENELKVEKQKRLELEKKLAETKEISPWKQIQKETL